MSYQAGGRIRINMGGTVYSPRGKATIDGAGLDNKRNENHDGTVSRSTMSKACSAEITLDRGNVVTGTQRPKWDATFMQGFYDVSITELDVGVQHLFNNAFIEGTPKLDTESGEIAGLTIVCAGADYTQTTV